METNLTNKRYTVKRYVNKTLASADMQKVEKIIEQTKDLKDIYSIEEQERDFIIQLIPDRELSQDRKSHIRNELEAVMHDIYHEEKKSIWQKINDYLEKPAFKIRF